MSRVLMPIKPEYASKILTRQKRFEFRKRKCAREIDTILIYETAPVRLVIAEVEVIRVVIGTPSLVWEQTKDSAGIDKKFFDLYYRGRNTAVAYALGRVTRYDPPRTLADYGILTAPQSYVYINNDNLLA